MTYDVSYRTPYGTMSQFGIPGIREAYSTASRFRRISNPALPGKLSVQDESGKPIYFQTYEPK